MEAGRHRQALFGEGLGTEDEACYADWVVLGWNMATPARCIGAGDSLQDSGQEEGFLLLSFSLHPFYASVRCNVL